MNTILQSIVCCCCIAFMSCNESLPVREDVSNLISATVLSKYYVVPNSATTGTVGQIQLMFSIKNNMDETLDDIARLEGTLEVTWLPREGDERNFTTTRTFKLNRSNIIYAKQYNQVSRRLTLAPFDSVILGVVWDLKTDDSTNLLMHFRAVMETSCYVYHAGGIWNRRFTERQNYRIAGSIKVFDRLAVLTAKSITVRHCLKGLDMGEANASMGLPPCADLAKVDPCSLIGQ